MTLIEIDVFKKIEVLMTVELKQRSFLCKINLVHTNETKITISDNQILIETRIHEMFRFDVYGSSEPNPPATQGNKSQVVGTIYPLLALAKEVS